MEGVEGSRRLVNGSSEHDGERREKRRAEEENEGGREGLGESWKERNEGGRERKRSTNVGKRPFTTPLLQNHRDILSS